MAQTTPLYVARPKSKGSYGLSVRLQIESEMLKIQETGKRERTGEAKTKMERGANVFFISKRKKHSRFESRVMEQQPISIELSFLPQPYQNRYTNRLKGVALYIVSTQHFTSCQRTLWNTRYCISIWKGVNLLIEHSSQSRHTHDYI